MSIDELKSAISSRVNLASAISAAAEECDCEVVGHDYTGDTQVWYTKAKTSE